ncbi:MAG: hypothetical protein CMA25_04955 [Euryarchaeota archaeon]|nr:hypothetical protein [Euryarchaeota archaeon]|tara:strand:- start:412 stop:942 length:531 start_codon:yes stop_codon:yes gene_type:complete
MTEVHAIWLEQDDPKKNTAVKLSKHNLIKLHRRLNRLPRKGIVLDPLCGKVLGPEDREIIDTGGALVGLDCSWANIETSVNQITKKSKLERRTLPLFLAANPVNWGKVSKLSTAEALAASLWILGHENQARLLLSKFNWGSSFIDLNLEPLTAYSCAKTSQEVVSLQFEFFDIRDD